jgi:hypothetical protein
MFAILLAQYGVSLLGSLVAVAISSVAGPASFNAPAWCIVLLSGLAGRLFARHRSELGLAPVVKATGIYLASLAVLMFALGHLDPATARTLARGFAAWGIGPGVGMLVFQWSVAPVAFALTLWRVRRSQESRVRQAINFRLVSKGSAGD